MCGRYAFTRQDEPGLKKRFGLKTIDGRLVPRYNIAPAADVPVILNDAPDVLVFARWGLVPSWAKEAKTPYKMINARVETVADKPAYRGPFRRRRCLILADGFYEWKKASGGKRPYWIGRADGEPFAFAGLWDVWEKGEAPLRTCAIITTAAAGLMRSIHDRMPVILRPEAEGPWLTGDEPGRLRELLDDIDPQALAAREVSTAVNSPANDSPDVMLPLSP